jgi:DNA-directed RNA polymerase subunit RPC12/RpoP
LQASPNQIASSSGPVNAVEEITLYPCSSCGKAYKWKATLIRHMNDECGKEPKHQCPHCIYKAKQRGNLLVHIKRHHPDKPKPEGKRRSKFSNPSKKENI